MNEQEKTALLDQIDAGLAQLGPSRPSADRVTRAKTIFKGVRVACQSIAISPATTDGGAIVVPPTPGPETPPIEPAPPETPPSGGGGGGSTSPPTTTTVTTTYTSQGDFGGTQGYRGWTYLNGNLEDVLTYDAARQLWTGPQLYQFIWSDGCHSGPSIGVVRRFTSPSTSTYSITGSIKFFNDPIGGTSGLPVTIKKNGVSIYSQTVADNDIVGYAVSGLTGSVTVGDTLDFFVGPPSGPGTAHENFNTTFSIALTTTTTTGGGSSTQTTLPFTLNGTAPEEGTYTLTANKPSNADGCTIQITGVNLAASYGRVYFNGSANSLALWPTAPWNAGISATVTVAVPVAYLVNGNNTLRFTHDSGSGYTITAIGTPVFTTPATPTPPATQTSLPFDLRGAILPEDAILTTSLSKPSNANGATMTITGVNLTGTTGSYYINGQLAGAIWDTVPANAGVSATVTLSPNVNLFQNGNNAIRFTHTSGSGYTVSSVSVTFSTPSPGTTDPPPPSNTGQWPNEPIGMTILSDWGHNAVTGGGWYDVYGGFTTSVVTDATAPLSPSNVLQQRWAQGLVGGNGGGGGSLFAFPRAYGSMYWGTWMKVDANFENHPSGSKLGWIHTTLNGTPQQNQLFYSMTGTGPYALRLTYQNGTVDNTHLGGDSPRGTVNLSPSSAGQFVGGQWVKIEHYFRPSTTNTAQNGIWKLWVNGVLAVNVLTLNTEAIQPDSVSRITIWGGTGGIKSRDSYIWWDHERVSVL